MSVMCLLAHGSQDEFIGSKSCTDVKKYKFNSNVCIFPNNKVEIVEPKFLIFTSNLTIDEFKNKMKNIRLIVTVLAFENAPSDNFNLFTYFFDLMMEMNKIEKIGNKIIMRFPFYIGIEKFKIYQLFGRKLKITLENAYSNLEQIYNFEQIELLNDEIMYDLPTKYKDAEVDLSLFIQQETINEFNTNNVIFSMLNSLNIQNQINDNIYQKHYEYTIQEMNNISEINTLNENIIKLNWNHPTKGFFILGNIDNIKGFQFELNGHKLEYIDAIMLKLYAKRLSNNLLFYSFDGKNKYKHATIDSYINSINFSRIDTIKLRFDVCVSNDTYKIYGLNFNVVNISTGLIGMSWS